MATKYPAEIVGMARALLVQGHHLRGAEAIIKESYGYGPSDTAIQEWSQAWKPDLRLEQDEAILDSARRHVLKGDALTERVLDHLRTVPDAQLVKLLVPLNILTGTKTDKLLRSKQGPALISSSGPIMIVINAQATPENPTLVEGTIVDPDPPDYEHPDYEATE